MKVNCDAIIVLVFYLILIGVIGIQLKKVFDTETAFEEFEINNDTRLPSFTLCPYYSSNSIETFEEAMVAIDNAKNDYSMTMNGYQRFEKRQVIVHIPNQFELFLKSLVQTMFSAIT